MLDRDDDIKVGNGGNGPQRQLVTLGIVPRGVVQVLDRVDVEQRGPVGELREHPEHQPGGQQRGGQPVPAQQAGNCRRRLTARSPRGLESARASLALRCAVADLVPPFPALSGTSAAG